MPAGGPGQVAAGGGQAGLQTPLARGGGRGSSWGALAALPRPRSQGQAGAGGGDLLGVGGGGAGVQQTRPCCPAPALTPPVAVGGRKAAAGHTATLAQR